MHPFIYFLQEHPHCTQAMCTTCGGLLGFQWELVGWADAEGIDLTNLMQTLTNEDLEPINDWSAYVSRVLLFIPADQFQESVFPEWRKNAKRSEAFRKFLLFHAPPNGYDPNQDLDWVSSCLFLDLYHFSLKEIAEVERFLGSQVDKFPQILTQKLNLEKAHQIEIEISRRTEAERAKRRADEEKALKQKLLYLEKMQPADRLFALLKDPCCMLKDYPIEWVDIPDDSFQSLDSTQLTGILKLFDNHISRKEKSPWKDLRSRLYRLRQKVYNQEHFQRLSDKSISGLHDK